MLSILIPTYNYNITGFAESLLKQAQTLKCPYEIIILDDASKKKYLKINRRLNNYKNITYEELAENIGRARIRNILGGMAHHDHLLFVDCDSEVPDKYYLKRYIHSIKNNSVTYGGRIYSNTPPSYPYFLHWKFGIKREVIKVNKRAKNPNRSFMTNNFLISKSIFESIKFNENISLYGHEDTLFGYELKKRNITIEHINNPLIHKGLETNDAFINKTKESINNLHFLLNNHLIDKGIITDISLLKWHTRASKAGLEKMLANYYKQKKSFLINQLKNDNPSLFWLDLFKLSYLSFLSTENK